MLIGTWVLWLMTSHPFQTMLPQVLSPATSDKPNFRQIHLFLLQQATQLLVLAVIISRHDYCNAVLTGLLACALNPLQMVQNGLECHPGAHWALLAPIAACIKFKPLTVAYKVNMGHAYSYVHLLLNDYVAPWLLHSFSEYKLASPKLDTKQFMRFSFLVPWWWRKLLDKTWAYKYREEAPEVWALQRAFTLLTPLTNALY